LSTLLTILSQTTKATAFKFSLGKRPPKAGICSKRLVICCRFNFAASDLHNYATGWLFSFFHFLLHSIVWDVKVVSSMNMIRTPALRAAMTLVAAAIKS
jgi:hypothetical protein